MSVATAPQSLAERIEHHSGAQDTFSSFGELTQHTYHIVDTGMDSTRNLCWGYCETTNSYYISSSVQVSLRVGILQLEEYRIRNRVTHLNAVQFAFAQPNNINYELVRTLYDFYQEESRQYSTPTAVGSPQSEDIIATRRYLAERL